MPDDLPYAPPLPSGILKNRILSACGLVALCLELFGATWLIGLFIRMEAATSAPQAHYVMTLTDRIWYTIGLIFPWLGVAGCVGIIVWYIRREVGASRKQHEIPAPSQKP